MTTATKLFASQTPMHHLAAALIVYLLAAFACAEVIPYAGVIGGVATLSADAGARNSVNGLSLSSYAPQNGAALNLFVGLHLHAYFSLQGNYIWNRNDLILNSSSSQANTFYQQARISSQHAGVLDF